MRTINSRSGFTLMEIIVVMIILGIVSAIALPNVFGQIEKSRAQEAVSNMSTLRQQIDGCIAANGGSSFGCGVATIATPNFNYGIAGIDATALLTAGTAVITATRVQNPGGAAVPAAASTVILTRVPANNNWTCAGTGVYVGTCR